MAERIDLDEMDRLYAEGAVEQGASPFEREAVRAFSAQIRQSWPQISAVLRGAKGFASAWPGPPTAVVDDSEMCVLCECSIYKHSEECPWKTIVEAIQPFMWYYRQ